jgi:hypothetical protein
MAEWITLTLKGSGQVIPKTCPNCLAAATVQHRISHRFLNTTHYQTFNYCAYCSRTLGDGASVERWKLLAYLLGAVITVGGAIGLIKLIGPTSPGWIPLGVLIAAIAGGWAFIRFVKRGKLALHPLRAEQAEWGPAVYYIGHGAFGFNVFTAKYKARRREWLRELVRLNPAQVTDSVYLEWVGSPRPADPAKS